MSRLAWDAWIETFMFNCNYRSNRSRLAWDAWIETSSSQKSLANQHVASRMGRVDWNPLMLFRWIFFRCRVSHGTRGLKLFPRISYKYNLRRVSHGTRGLKQLGSPYSHIVNRVASRMGRVDWNVNNQIGKALATVASRMGRVDWNYPSIDHNVLKSSRVSHGTRGLKPEMPV